MPVQTRSSLETRHRLIEAAVAVARAGLQGATTREIARTAAVNEVTLFRHFKNKEQLLQAVVDYSFSLQKQTLEPCEEWTGNVREDVRRYARLYYQMLESNEALIRMFIGEAKRHPEAARAILHEAARARRERKTAYLRTLQQQGKIRPDIDPAVAVDLFTGMLLAGVLRSGLATVEYSRERYLDSCVDLWLRGLALADASAPSATSEPHDPDR